MKNEIHSCFNTSSNDLGYGRIHIPIAKVCKMGCKYCNYVMDGNVGINIENRPGTSNLVINNREEMLKYLEEKTKIFPKINIIGVSGPGDPLDNMDNLEILNEVMNEQYKDYKLCICSCGYNYNNVINRIKNLNKLEYLTLTINTLDIRKMKFLYRSVNDGILKADEIINQQKSIIKDMKERNVKIKINTIYIPNINDNEINSMFSFLLKMGVDCFNLLPLRQINNQFNYDKDLYLDNFKNKVKELKELGFPMINKCSQCTSSACGRI